jgi:soluble lytic murein transglycosylase-like protein
MAEKSFVDAKLSKEQIDNAILIADKANEYGVNADLALAMAWQENRFRTKGKSSAGAIGLLQIMPANAKPYGYRSEERRVGKECE